MKIKQSVFVTNYPSIECEGFQGHLFKTKFKRLRQLNTKTPAQETRAIINFPSSQQCSTQLILYFWEVCDFHLVLLRLDLQQIWEHYHYFWSFDISTGPTGVEFACYFSGNLLLNAPWKNFKNIAWVFEAKPSTYYTRVILWSPKPLWGNWTLTW